MRRSRRRHLEPTARTGGALEPSSVLYGRLGGLRRADPARPALRRQGPDPRHRAGPFPPAALAGAVPPPHLRSLQGQAHGGRLDRAVRPLRRSRRGQRTPIYASIRPWSHFAISWSETERAPAFCNFCQGIMWLDEKLALDLVEAFLPVAQKLLKED